MKEYLYTGPLLSLLESRDRPETAFALTMWVPRGNADRGKLAPSATTMRLVEATLNDLVTLGRAQRIEGRLGVTYYRNI